MSINDFEYVEPASRMQLAEKLNHQSSYAAFMILLLGEPGSGRSMLLDQLEELHEPRTQRLARIDLLEKTDVSRLLAALVDAMQLDAVSLTDNRKRLAAVHKQIRALAEVHIALHLHIDNADLLTDNGLELLLSLMQLGDSAPHVLLTALPEFEQRAEEKGVLDRLGNRVHIQRLKPFEQTEVEDFALSLLPAHVELTPKQLKKLVELSGGLPGNIITSVESLLRHGGGQSTVKNFPLPMMHMVAIMGVLLLITGFAVWHYLPSPMPDDTVEITRIQVAPEPISVTVEPIDVQIEARESLAKRLAEQEALLEVTIEEELSIVPEPIVLSDISEVITLNEALVQEEALAKEEALAQEEEIVAVTETTPDDAEVLQQETLAAVSTPTDKPVILQSEVKELPSLEIEKSEQQSEVSAIVVDEKTTTVVQSQPPAIVQVEPEPRVAPIAPQGSQAASLLDWPDSGFTLQMLGARSEESVVRFIQSQTQPQRFYRFVTLHQGAPWHVVVYGQYPTRAAATEAIRSLPAELRDRSPWARTISSVKEDIRKIDQ